MSTQGKCPKCKVAYRFDMPAVLSMAKCPKCNTQLVRTSYLFKGPWRDETYCFGNFRGAAVIERLYCAAGILLGFGWTVLWMWMADAGRGQMPGQKRPNASLRGF